MRTGPFIRRRLALLSALAVVAVLAGVGPVVAADPPPPQDTQSGKVGVHSLVDTPATPGGTCIYGITVNGIYFNHLDRVRVRRPVAFARQGRSSQRIASRLTVQEWDGTSWIKHRRTGWQARSATPTAAAAFSSRTKVVDSLSPGDHFGYRARIDLRWFGSDGRTVVGRATLFPRHYVAKEDPHPDFPLEDDCGSTTG